MLVVDTLKFEKKPVFRLVFRLQPLQSRAYMSRIRLRDPSYGSVGHRPGSPNYVTFSNFGVLTVSFCLLSISRTFGPSIFNLFALILHQGLR